MSSKVKDAIATWLWFDLFFAIFLWFTIGPEGLAAMACTVVDHEVCADLEQ